MADLTKYVKDLPVRGGRFYPLGQALPTQVCVTNGKEAHVD